MSHPSPRSSVGVGRSRSLVSLGMLVMWLASATSSLAAASASPSPPPAATERLQTLVDATPAGGVLDVAPGLYREAIVIRRPITLEGTGAEIRGSDVWSDWTADGARWRSASSVPDLKSGGECRDPRCAWPEQVFLDGRPLLQVEADPRTGQFALDAGRHVILADDPAAATVEVTTRSRWITVEATDTTIEGFVMRDVASPAQSGGIQASQGADRLSIRDVTLSDSHGALVSFDDVADGRLLDSDLSRGGQLAIHASGVDGLTVTGNTIADSNTEGFDPTWEAGGFKAAHAVGLVVRDNEVLRNDGPGIWCDLDCSGFEASGNRVGSNTRAGIMFEVSDGGVIESNVVWDNGWGFATWGWGAGILVSSSASATVEHNTLAWNADGITVVSQQRERATDDHVHDVSVVDNTVIAEPGSSSYLLAWLEDWDGGIYDASAHNGGSDNAFWSDRPEPADCIFEWSGCRDRIADFASTQGGRASRYLTEAQHVAALVGAQLAVAPPPPHAVVNDPPRRSTVVFYATLAAIVVLVPGVTLVAVLLIRRRTRARSV